VVQRLRSCSDNIGRLAGDTGHIRRAGFLRDSPLREPCRSVFKMGRLPGVAKLKTRVHRIK